MDRGLVTRNDEMASTRRMFQHLIGQSGKCSLRQDLKDKCLRDKVYERKKADLTLKSMVMSLQRLRKESWSSGVKTRARLNPSQYWSKVREMRKRSKNVRTVERCRLEKKIEWLKLKSVDCENHYICNWMKHYREE